MTLSWRGLDQRAYYRVDGRGRDIDVTGCGNTLDLRTPSSRGWCSTRCATGCRSATSTASASTSPSALGRGKDDGYDRDHPFLVALRTDPVPVAREARRRAVGPRHARLAHRPVPAAVLGVERPLPRRDPHLLAARPRRLRVGAASATASASWPPGSPGRRTSSTGTTVAPSPRSTSSPPTTGSRWPTSRSTTRSTTGPTVTAGPTGPTTTGRGTTGSRGAPTTPTSPRPAAGRCATCSARCCCRPVCRCSTPGTRSDAASAATTTRTPRTTRSAGRRGTSIRGRRTCSRPPATSCDCVATTRSFGSGRSSPAGGSTPDGSTDLAWFRADGAPMGDHWDGPAVAVLQGLYNGAAISEQSVLIVVNGSAGAVDVTLPAAPGVTAYVLLWDSADERPTPPSDPVAAGEFVSMAAASMRVWSSTGA